MNGIVIIDKPQGWTSQDVTARLRRVFNTRRIGHGGTLDPMATGVLPVFVGRGTRGVEFFEHAEKTYETVLRLGLTTDTEDVWGETQEERPVEFTGEKLEEVLKWQFREKRHKLQLLAGRLEGCSPVKKLSGGFREWKTEQSCILNLNIQEFRGLHMNTTAPARS